MEAQLMHLKVLLPFEIFARKEDVLRIIAETPSGSFGLLPRRLDCTAALAPGILTYETAAEGTVYVAVDAGVLVKTGPEVNRRCKPGEASRSCRAGVSES